MSARQQTRDSPLTSGPPIVAVGLRRSAISDLYHFLLTSRWWQLLLILASMYVAANVLFALAYLILGDAIEHARPGSFADAFFFSVQTMATVGYGNFWPRTTAANILATAEMITGGMALALMTGLVFTKFARPTARVLFARYAVIRRWEGVPSFMFRMANARSSQIVEAHVSVMLVRTQRTAEGDEVRRLTDLRLLRAQHALFALTWTAVHPIDEVSPLHGATPESLAADDAVVVISFTGFDESLAATIHARQAYPADRILFGRRLVDVIVALPDGTRVIDYRKFHDTEPEQP